MVLKLKTLLKVPSTFMINKFSFELLGYNSIARDRYFNISTIYGPIIGKYINESHKYDTEP